MKGHAKTLCCTHIIGYAESCTIYGEVCVLSAIGTAAVVKATVHPAVLQQASASFSLAASGFSAYVPGGAIPLATNNSPALYHCTSNESIAPVGEEDFDDGITGGPLSSTVANNNASGHILLSQQQSQLHLQAEQQKQYHRHLSHSQSQFSQQIRPRNSSAASISMALSRSVRQYSDDYEYDEDEGMLDQYADSPSRRVGSPEYDEDYDENYRIEEDNEDGEDVIEEYGSRGTPRLQRGHQGDKSRASLGSLSSLSLGGGGGTAGSASASGRARRSTIDSVRYYNCLLSHRILPH